jgi:hypothetical protein
LHFGSPGLPHLYPAALGGGQRASDCVSVSTLGLQLMILHHPFVPCAQAFSANSLACSLELLFQLVPQPLPSFFAPHPQAAHADELVARTRRAVTAMSRVDIGPLIAALGAIPFIKQTSGCNQKGASGKFKKDRGYGKGSLPPPGVLAGIGHSQIENRPVTA